MRGSGDKLMDWTPGHFELLALTVVAEGCAICSFGGLAVKNRFAKNVGLVPCWHLLAHHELAAVFEMACMCDARLLGPLVVPAQALCGSTFIQQLLDVPALGAKPLSAHMLLSM